MVKGKKQVFLDALLNNLCQNDVTRSASSSFNYCPRNSPFGRRQGASYLEKDYSLFTKRLLCQIRCANPSFCRVVLNGIVNRFDSSTSCSICSADSPDTLLHLISSCKVYSYERSKYFGATFISEAAFRSLILCNDRKEVGKLVGFLQTVFTSEGVHNK